MTSRTPRQLTTEQIADKSLVIRKSNELIEARYKLSLEEQRLVLLLASVIKPEDDDFQDYEIQVGCIAEQFGLELTGSLYSYVEQAAETLLGKVITLKNNKSVAKTVWLSYVEYVKGSGKIKIRFDKSLKPYLLQLKSHFTQYDLNYVSNFKSQYSIRIYELLKMEAYKAKAGRFERSFTLKELRGLLALVDEYPLFGDFKKRVIVPATDEITEQTDLKIVGVVYGKTGRKVTCITFEVETRSETDVQALQLQLQLQQAEPKPADELHPVLRSLVELGFAVETAKTYKNKYGVRRIERNIAYTLAKKQEGAVKDIPAYLNKAIKEDMGGAWEVAKAKQQQNKNQQEAAAAKREAIATQAHLKKMQELANGVKPESNHAKNAEMARNLSSLLDD